MKQIPIALQSHLQQPATTWCFLMRVACVGRWAGTVMGFTTLDADLEYDDGKGGVRYRSDNGFKPDRLQTAADFSVGNTDMSGWVTADGITAQDVAAGMFDYAEVTVYRVNYMDLTQGHELVLFGTCGQTKTHQDAWTTEFRSLMQQAKQTISTVYSLTCRAEYGDSKCQMAFVWESATVADIGSDPRRMITSSGLAHADGYFDLGVIEWLTGRNSGLQSEVDEFLDNGDIRLSLPTGFPISEGDTFRIRQDCDKAFATCKAKGNVLQFRGEHLTPVADTAISAPGAYIPSVDSA